MIDVEVAYAKPGEQVVLPVKLEIGSTVIQAIIASGILQSFPEIGLNEKKIGVFGQICDPTRVLKAGDRVEIYRALVNDPMEARRLRAKRAGKCTQNTLG